MILNTNVPPKDAVLHGHALLQLLDPDTGKVIDQSEGDNYVGWQGLVHNLWKLRSDFNASNPGTNTDPEPLNPFNQVHLSTDITPLSYPSAPILGDGVGWASKATYSGGDLYRGSMVSAECSTTPTLTTWVFEWPTTAAIGDIGSVGWRNSGGKECETWLYEFYRNGSTDPVVGGGIPLGGSPPAYGVFMDTPTTFFQISSAGLGKFTIDRPNHTITQLWAGPTLAQMGLTMGKGVTSDGTNLYVVGNTANIRKFTIPTGSGDVTESSVSVSGVTSFEGIAYDNTYLWVGSGTTVYRVDKSTGAIERQFNVGHNIYGLTWDTSRSLLLVYTGSTSSNKFMTYWDINGVRKASLNHTAGIDNQSPVSSAVTVVPGSAELFMSRRDGGFGGIQEFHTTEVMGTRLVLGSPVTKTNLTSMKLTYTFTYV